MSTPKVPDIDFLTNSVAYAIKRAQVRTYDVLFDVYDEEQITPARMTALCLIGTQTGLSQSALADLLHINRASVIKIVNHLQGAGYINCRENEADRRSHILELTPEGHDKLLRLSALTVILEQEVTKHLTAKERDTLMRLLDKVGR